MNEKTISKFLDEDYASYGMYTIEHRAIPSVIDGFKPTQRKVIYIANKVWKTGNEKPKKIFQLGGRVADEGAYHHGDTSLNSTIIGMAQKFKNSLPLLDEIGQFGSLRSPGAGAPRYISTKLNQNFRLIYKDFELIESQYEDGLKIEPKFFLPIIPTVLLNGSSGIAVGFATNILNRNPIDLIDSCLAVLQNKKFKEPLPYWNSFTGYVEQSEENPLSFRINGHYDILGTNTVKVTELPPSMTYQKYENHLNKLLDGGHITSYDDNCKKNIDYTIKFTRAALSDRIKKNQLENLLKLSEGETENLTCLDENGKLIIFDSVSSLIKYFVNFRLGYFQKRKDFIIKELESLQKLQNNKARFIKMIIDDKLKIRNRLKSDVILDLESLKFDKVSDSFDYLLNMPIQSITKERYEELLGKIKENSQKIKSTRETEPIDMYTQDLKDLKSAIKKQLK